MMQRLLASVTLAGALASLLAAGSAHATTANVSFAGPGVGASLVLTYGAATDATYPNAYEVTGVSGTFTAAAAGILAAPVTALVAVNHATPDATNYLAPHDFSRFAVASGLPPVSNGYITYDNLFWPAGSPQTASDYPGAGGFLDIYGLLLDLGGGVVADIWSNGSIFGSPLDYGVAVATASTALDYVAGGVSASVPEPASLALLGMGAFGLLLRRRSAAV